MTNQLIVLFLNILFLLQQPLTSITLNSFFLFCTKSYPCSSQYLFASSAVSYVDYSNARAHKAHKVYKRNVYAHPELIDRPWLYAAGLRAIHSQVRGGISVTRRKRVHHGGRIRVGSGWWTVEECGAVPRVYVILFT